MKLGNPQETIEVLKKHDFRFQKKYGQNFLIDPRVLDKIIDAAQIDKDDYVLGVRPEFVHICDDGPIEGEIFSAMPTGMETTVRIRVGNYLLTGVVFGGVLYKIGQKVRLRFDGEGTVLFSRVNGRLVSCGKLDIAAK